MELFNTYFFIFLSVLFLELYSCKCKFIKHCYSFFAYCMVTSMPSTTYANLWLLLCAVLFCQGWGPNQEGVFCCWRAWRGVSLLLTTVPLMCTYTVCWLIRCTDQL